MILPFRKVRPQLGRDVYVAPDATIIGDVVVGNQSSIWFQTVIRGDVNSIRIGQRCNIQDHCTLHVTRSTHPLHIGDEVSFGHRAVVHGCTLGNRVLVGMGAILLDGCVIGEDSIIGAGSVVAEGTKIPPRSVVFGVPGRPVRPTRDSDLQRIEKTCIDYLELSGTYLREMSR